MQSVVIRTAYNEYFEGNNDVKSIKAKIASYNNVDLPASMILYGIIEGKAILEKCFSLLIGNAYRLKFREITEINFRTSLDNIKSKVILHYFR